MPLFNNHQPFQHWDSYPIRSHHKYVWGGGGGGGGVGVGYCRSTLKGELSTVTSGTPQGMVSASCCLKKAVEVDALQISTSLQLVQ